MHGIIAAEKPPVEVIRRTITLTNRSPISILESEFPLVAEGKCSYDVGAPWEWEVAFRVRNEHKPEDRFCLHRAIVYGVYRYYDSDNDENSQLIRVGHLLDEHEHLMHLWKHMIAIGEEMRERVENKFMLKHVINALDKCFAALTADEL
jgi:hypothetical protein